MHKINYLMNLDPPTSSEFNRTLKKLIMDYRAPDGKHFAVTITSNRRESMEPWVKINVKSMQVL